MFLTAQQRKDKTMREEEERRKLVLHSLKHFFFCTPEVMPFSFYFDFATTTPFE
jgi:hypothetical protein